MYVKKMCGYVVLEGIFSDFKKGILDSYAPPTRESRNYKNWTAILDLKTCLECRARHGQIYHMGEIPDEEPPLHPNCRCKIKPMKAVKAGNGTKAGQNGADWWMKYNANLPEHYITEEELKKLGWRWRKNREICTGEIGSHGNLPIIERIICRRFQDEFGLRPYQLL